MLNVQRKRNWFDLNLRSNLFRFFYVLLAGALTIKALPHEEAISYFAWICMVPFVLSLNHANPFERLGFGFLYGCLYSLPGQWSSIWFPVSQKDWSLLTSCFLIALFFSCFVVPFVIFSLVKPYLTAKSFFSSINQSIFLTCIIAWFPTYFTVTPACMIHDQPLLYQTADFGGLAIVIFSILYVNIVINRIHISQGYLVIKKHVNLL